MLLSRNVIASNEGETVQLGFLTSPPSRWSILIFINAAAVAKARASKRSPCTTRMSGFSLCITSGSFTSASPTLSTMAASSSPLTIVWSFEPMSKSSCSIIRKVFLQKQNISVSCKQHNVYWKFQIMGWQQKVSFLQCFWDARKKKNKRLEAYFWNLAMWDSNFKCWPSYRSYLLHTNIEWVWKIWHVSMNILGLYTLSCLKHADHCYTVCAVVWLLYKCSNPIR